MRPTDHNDQPYKSIVSLTNVQKHIDGWKTGRSSSNKKKLNPGAINYLFKRFARIWGYAWEKDFNNDPEGIAEEWADALAGLSKDAIDVGISKARLEFLEFPPKIGAFRKLCEGTDVAPSVNNFICSIGGCPNPGTICRATHGNNWICSKHYHEGKG